MEKFDYNKLPKGKELVLTSRVSDGSELNPTDMIQQELSTCSHCEYAVYITGETIARLESGKAIVVCSTCLPITEVFKDQRFKAKIGPQDKEFIQQKMNELTDPKKMLVAQLLNKRFNLGLDTPGGGKENPDDQ